MVLTVFRLRRILHTALPISTINRQAPPAKPPTLYGVYKQANEGQARNYWEEYGIRSVGLRPYIVYGPGRDQGLTSAPTTASMTVGSGAYRSSAGLR